MNTIQYNSKGCCSYPHFFQPYNTVLAFVDVFLNVAEVVSQTFDLVVQFWVHGFNSVLSQTVNKHHCGTWWRFGRVESFRGFESRSSRHVWTMGRFLTRSFLWRFGV